MEENYEKILTMRHGLNYMTKKQMMVKVHFEINCHNQQLNVIELYIILLLFVVIYGGRIDWKERSKGRKNLKDIVNKVLGLKDL